MSRAYSSTPLSELTDAELREILLTCDGRGKEVKERALEVLLGKRDPSVRQYPLSAKPWPRTEPWVPTDWDSDGVGSIPH